MDLASGYPCLFIKEAEDSAGGHGVVYYDCKYGREKLKEQLLKINVNTVIQSGLVQHPEMSKLNPSSVNTVRALTFITKEGDTKILSTVVRIGRNGSHTDNASSGGITVGVNLNGSLKSTGYDIEGKTYTKHPDTNTRFSDIIIPNFDIIKKEVIALQWQLNQFRMLSWDIAIDKDGIPIIIEVNMHSGQIDFHQLNNGPVFGEDTEKVLSEVFNSKRTHQQIKLKNMDYKAVIKNPETRYAILRALSWIPDKPMICLQYRIKQGYWPNLKNPQRFTEWLQWYKMNYRKPIMQQCVDKAEVREYIKKKGLKDILIPEIGVYDKVEDIQPELLPEKFVMKTTGGGGGLNVILCHNKSHFNFEKAFANLRKWLVSRSTDGGREWAYKGIKKSRVIIEELLEQPDGSDISDYKIMCFNGIPKVIVLDKDRYTNHKRNFYTSDWKYIDAYSDHGNAGDIYARPMNFNRMLEIASKLSEGFPFVRVDLYNINGKIYFGELTFYPWSGYVKFTPDDFDFTLGKMFDKSFFA